MSCGSSKIVRTSERTMKGNWVLSSINYSEPGTYNTTLLNDASKACFEGSTWQFVPNNNTGIYTINDTNCSTGERYFVFTVKEINADTGLYDFLLKPTDDSQGSEDHNMTLSKNRAYAVTNYLTGNGISSGRLTTNWFGESQPMYDNSTADGRAKNRRVNIAILPNEKMIEDAKQQVNNQ